MTQTFDPYHQWLGIPPTEQPPNHYRLLGLATFESDANVISSAADRQMAHLRTFQLGPHAAHSQRLLSELALASRCLLSAARRASYDVVLRSAAPADREEEASPPAQGKGNARAAPVAALSDAAEGMPKRFGPYEVLERLSASRLGVTFKVTHPESGRLFALKTLPRDLLRSDEARKRFRREIEIVTRLDHPNLIAGLDTGESGGFPYLVTPFVLGTDLGTLVAQHGPLSVEQATDYLAQAARGLTQLHLCGVYHRNLKPQVLIVDMQGQLRVTNLMLARVGAGSEMADDENLTKMGSMMGSVEYLPPEQAVDARQSDARSDVYALGCVLHFLLTGKPPFGGKSVTERVLAHQRAAVPSLVAARRDVPPALQALFEKMLAKDPAQRPQFMGAVVEALQPSPAPSWWGRLLVAIGLKRK